MLYLALLFIKPYESTSRLLLTLITKYERPYKKKGVFQSTFLVTKPKSVHIFFLQKSAHNCCRFALSYQLIKW